MLVLVSDLDGTLINVKDRFAHAQVNALAQLGYTITVEQVAPFVQYMMDADKFLTGLGISLESSEILQYLALVEREFYQGWHHSYVIPGVIEALLRVRPRVDALRLITSRAWIADTHKEVEAFGLDQVFNHHVYTRGHLAKAEGVDEIPLFPFLDHRQRLIQLAIADIDSPDIVWVIGDSPNEMKAAWDLGLITVGVLTGFSTAEELEPFCTHILNSAAEITTLL
ncbi:MAG: HAD family hydrolase [Candidatus Hodarchaeota archaeon]